MQEVLARIKPSEKEEQKVRLIVNKFIEKLNKKLERAKCFIGGSFGKDTWLRGDHDVDLFVRFEDDTDCSNVLELALKRSFSKVERVHGSRDYFQVLFKHLNFEIVPVFNINDAKDARNVTDVSPLHVGWVKKNSTKGVRDQIRLAKQFFKAQKVYGAETYIKGFSGYVIEILIIYYGSLDKLAKAAVKWKIGTVINPSEKKYKLNKDKISPLIIVDPVQPNRNTSAALSLEKFEIVKKACKKLTLKKDKKYFEVKKINVEDYMEKDIVLMGKAVKGKKDIVGTRLLKVYENLILDLNNEGYGVIDSGWDWDDKAYFWFNVKRKELQPFKERAGPTLDRLDNVLMFKEKHAERTIVEKDERLYVILPRIFVKLNKFVQWLVKNANSTGNVRGLRVVKV